MKQHKNIPAAAAKNSLASNASATTKSTNSHIGSIGGLVQIGMNPMQGSSNGSMVVPQFENQLSNDSQ
jgi:hypothetical protein